MDRNPHERESRTCPFYLKIGIPLFGSSFQNMHILGIRRICRCVEASKCLRAIPCLVEHLLSYSSSDFKKRRVRSRIESLVTE